MDQTNTKASINHQFNDLFYGVAQLTEENFSTHLLHADTKLDTTEDEVYFLIDGTLSLYHHNDGLVSNPYRMHHFDLIGIYELFYPSAIQTEYRAITDCEIAALDRQLFVKLTKEYPAFYERVLVQLINRQSMIATHYIRLINSPVIDRIAQFIAFAIDLRYFEKNETFVLLDSHQVIADSVGCNIRSIHRGIKTLKDGGYIDIVGGKVTINRVQYLKCENFS